MQLLIRLNHQNPLHILVQTTVPFLTYTVPYDLAHSLDNSYWPLKPHRVCLQWQFPSWARTNVATDLRLIHLIVCFSPVSGWSVPETVTRGNLVAHRQKNSIDHRQLYLAIHIMGWWRCRHMQLQAMAFCNFIVIYVSSSSSLSFAMRESRYKWRVLSTSVAAYAPDVITLLALKQSLGSPINPTLGTWNITAPLCAWWEWPGHTSRSSPSTARRSPSPRLSLTQPTEVQ